MSDRFISHMLSRNIQIEEDLIDQLFNSAEKRLARTLLLLARYGMQVDDLNDVVSPGDIDEYASANGLEMWHRWQAVITPTDVTISLDLFRVARL